MTLDPSSRLPAVARTPREHERTRRGRASDPHADAAEHGTTETASYALGEISNVKAIKSLTFCGFQLLGEGRTAYPSRSLSAFLQVGFPAFLSSPGGRETILYRAGRRAQRTMVRTALLDRHTYTLSAHDD